MPIVVLPVLWNILMTGLSSVWPVSRTAINGVPLGDAWPCSAMPQSGGSPISAFPSSHAPWEAILPLHKLTQYLTYSLMQPMQSLLKIHFAGAELLTGLPDYRNGGLFVDLGVLSLKKHDMERGLHYYTEYIKRTGLKGVEVAPAFEPNDDVVVEWRGVTVGLLDRLLIDVNRALGNELHGGEMTMAQLLEAGSWRVSLRSLHHISTFKSNILTLDKGRNRDCGVEQTEHEGAPNSGRLGWSCVQTEQRSRRFMIG